MRTSPGGEGHNPGAPVRRARYRAGQSGHPEACGAGLVGAELTEWPSGKPTAKPQETSRRPRLGKVRRLCLHPHSLLVGLLVAVGGSRKHARVPPNSLDVGMIGAQHLLTKRRSPAGLRAGTVTDHCGLGTASQRHSPAASATRRAPHVRRVASARSHGAGCFHLDADEPLAGVLVAVELQDLEMRRPESSSKEVSHAPTDMGCQDDSSPRT